LKSVLMKGNEALAEGAVRAGCRFYAGYPITPQSEILEYMAWRQDEVNGTFIQGESEIASACMVFGAVASGARAMTSSSSVGFTLKQEAISYILGADLPAVFVTVVRFGNGGSTITVGQDAYWQSVKGGAHGDYRLIVLAPNSVQESADMAYISFALAEKYRQPVIIQSDAAIGQMVEGCVLPDMTEHDINKYEWSAKGSSIDKKYKNIRDTLNFDMPKYVTDQTDKARRIMVEEQQWENYSVSDAEVIFVAYGISSRIARETVNLCRNNHIKAGLIRPKTLWPFPRKAFQNLRNDVKAFITIEMNIMGQMREDVLHAVRYQSPVYTYASNVEIPDSNTAAQMADDVLNGKIREEEVY